MTWEIGSRIHHYFPLLPRSALAALGNTHFSLKEAIRYKNGDFSPRARKGEKTNLPADRDSPSPVTSLVQRGKKGKRESPKLKSNSPPPPPSPSFRQNIHLCSHRSKCLAHVSDGDGNGEGGILLPEKGKKGREGKEKGLFWYTCVVLFQAGAKWPIGKWARGWKCVRCGGGKPASGAISDPSLQRGMSQKGPRANLEEGKVPWRKIDTLSSSFRGDWDLFCFLADARHRLISDRWFVRRGSSLPQVEFIGGGGV